MTDWIDQWVLGLDHADTTTRGYRSYIRRHIRPYFLRKTVAEIDVIDCRTFKKDVSRRVGPGATNNIMMVLGMILDDAVPKLRKSSPIERTTRRGRYVKRKKERKRDLTMQAVEAVACNAREVFGESGYAFMWTMAMTGMRPGELFGLTTEYSYPAWPRSDLHLDSDEEERYAEDLVRYGDGAGLMPAIRVERQVQAVGRVRFCGPKYGSQRTLVLPPFLASMLSDLQVAHGRPWVFPGKRGGTLAAADFHRKYWRKIADGIPGATEDAPPRLDPIPAFQGKRLYLLRHGHKAWLDEDGHSRFAVESRMGHEVPGVEGVYSSVTVAMEKAIMDALQARWEKFRAD